MSNSETYKCPNPALSNTGDKLLSLRLAVNFLGLAKQGRPHLQI